MTPDKDPLLDYRRIAYLRYGETGAFDYRAYSDYYRRKLGSRVAFRKEWRCLDLACGFGNFLAFLREIGVERFTGVDSSAEAAAAAARIFGESRVVVADVFDYVSAQTDAFDLVSAIDFVEHIGKDDLFRLIGLLNSRQTEGGLLLIRTPNAQGLFGMAARYGDITHETCFTPASIGDVLARCGYGVQSVWEDGPAAGNPLQTLHWLIWQVARIGIRLLNAAETGSWKDGVLTRNMWVLAKKNRDASFSIS